MTPTNSQQLFEDALQLPEEERAKLAVALLETLDSEPDEVDQAAWSAEIQRRVKEMDEGLVSPVPWPDLRRQIMETGDDKVDR